MQHALSKVVWTEGMCLGPHHFQAQARFFEATLNCVMNQLRGAGYGFAGLSLDPVALRNKQLLILHARGVMPDGTPLQFPEFDPPLPPRPLDDSLFEGYEQTLDLYLTLPVSQPGAPNVSREGTEDAQARYAV